MRPIRNNTDYIVVHCSATRPSQSIGVDDIRKMHTDRGWDDIGYHIVITRGGDIQLGEDLKRWGAHVKGYNQYSVGVCLVGGIDEHGKAQNNFTEEQMSLLKITLTFLANMYPFAIIKGHRDLSPDLDGDGVVERHEWMKECPCFDVQTWWKTQNVDDFT